MSCGSWMRCGVAFAGRITIPMPEAVRAISIT